MPAIYSMLSGPASQGWKKWTEYTESRLASDNIFVCMFENTSAGGDEVGQGCSLTGASATLTEFGTVAGATGNKPTRVLDASDDYFLVNAAIPNLLAGESSWTVIIKTANTALSQNEFAFLCFGDFGGSGDNLVFVTGEGVADKIAISLVEESNTIWGGGGGTPLDVGSDTYSATGDIYICAWCDGSVTRCGWSTTKPTCWSDFGANKRLSSATPAVFGGDIDGAPTRIGSRDVGTFLNSDLYYIVIATECLIIND